MSLDYFAFKNENAETSFLGGVVSLAGDELSTKLYNLGVEYEAFVSDILYLGESNEITFEEAIKTRMKNSWFDMGAAEDKNKIERLIDESSFNLKPVSETKVCDALMNMYKGAEVDTAKLSDIMEHFQTSIEYYLKKPKAIYEIPSELNEELYDCGSVIGMYYTYITFRIFVVMYEGYAMLLVRGSNE